MKNEVKKISLYGYIKEVNKEEFSIEIYDPNGRYDGLSVFMIDDIKNINWDDEDTRVVELLIKEREFDVRSLHHILSY